MGTVFEDLIRRFNEDNNEEAGEHWTLRDVVKLMANLIIRPIENQIQDGTYLRTVQSALEGWTVAEQTPRNEQKRLAETLQHTCMDRKSTQRHTQSVRPIS